MAFCFRIPDARKVTNLLHDRWFETLWWRKIRSITHALKCSLIRLRKFSNIHLIAHPAHYGQHADGNVGLTDRCLDYRVYGPRSNVVCVTKRICDKGGTSRVSAHSSWLGISLLPPGQGAIDIHPLIVITMQAVKNDSKIQNHWC